MRKSALADLPAAPGLPVIGNLLSISSPRMYEHLVQWHRELGPVFTVTVPGRKLVVLAGAEANRFVAGAGRNAFSSGKPWAALDRAYGVERTMISADGPDHREYRRVQGRTYTHAYFQENTERLRQIAEAEIEALTDEHSVAVAPWCKRVVVRQLARVMLNMEAGPYLDDLVRYIQTVLMVTVTGQRPGLWLRLPHIRRAEARVHAMVDDLLNDHRRVPTGPARTPDLLDDMLAAQTADPDRWSDSELHQIALGAFVVGMDTAANSLAFVIYELARRPGLAAQIRAEVDALFDSDTPLAEGLERLSLLHGALLEALRLHPVAGALPREIVRDVEFAGHRLPAGSIALIATSATHWLDEHFADPYAFDPSRYQPPRAEHRPLGVYVPFGVGHHTCAGRGMAEGLILLNTALLLRHCDLVGDPDYRLRLVARPTQSPDRHFRVQFAPRRAAATAGHCAT